MDAEHISTKVWKQLLESVTRHEGLKLKPYRCSEGKLTIGYGRNLQDNGVTVEEAEFLLVNDLKNAIKDIKRMFPQFDTFSVNRQTALVDMMFNLGMPRFMQFKNMIGAINKADWLTASVEMLDSKWFSQVGQRAADLAKLIKEG